MNVYDFTVKAQDGSDVSLSDFKGKVLLIVNTATGCGFTPQYEDLQNIYDEFNEQGLEILDFPCNQFANQAPGDDDQIHEFCVNKFHTSFQQMKKSDVNGENELFGKKGPMGLMLKAAAKKMDKNYENNGNIKWNFTKFLIGRDGEILDRFEPTINMGEVKDKIKAAL